MPGAGLRRLSRLTGLAARAALGARASTAPRRPRRPPPPPRGRRSRPPAGRRGRAGRHGPSSAVGVRAGASGPWSGGARGSQGSGARRRAERAQRRVLEPPSAHEWRPSDDELHVRPRAMRPPSLAFPVSPARTAVVGRDAARRPTSPYSCGPGVPAIDGAVLRVRRVPGRPAPGARPEDCLVRRCAPGGGAARGGRRRPRRGHGSRSGRRRPRRARHVGFGRLVASDGATSKRSRRTATASPRASPRGDSTWRTSKSSEPPSPGSL